MILGTVDEGSLAFGRVVEGRFERIVDDSDLRFAASRYQCDGYGVARGRFDEGKGAVERIDAPKEILLESAFVVGAFFSEQSKFETL